MSFDRIPDRCWNSFHRQVSSKARHFDEPTHLMMSLPFLDFCRNPLNSSREDGISFEPMLPADEVLKQILT